MGNPRFNSARGLNMALQTPPPFDFRDVTMRVFPLRARLSTVQTFVDRYINIVPDEVAYFRAFLPYVYLMLINYGPMSSTAANLGWISQREIAFSIPLEMYRKGKDGKYSFVDWAYNSPFIFVDNELSMATGREVFGWPKTMAWYDHELNTWMEDPRATQRLATVSTMVFPELYSGKAQEPREFLRIEQLPPPSPTEVLPDIESPLLPWNAIPAAIKSSIQATRDYVQVLSGLGITRQRPPSGPDAWGRMLKQLAKFNPYSGQVYFNTINLKQFRSADAPHLVCYQGLTNAKMPLTSINRGGLLGDMRMCAGDATGGFRVQLHRWEAVPIIESLGLVVESQHRNGDVDVATLAPSFPLWMSVDMTYDLGETLVWRTKVSPWTVGTGPEAKTYDRELTDGSGATGLPLYNTLLGAATQSFAGPFDFPRATLRVLPLLADAAKLQAFCDDYLNRILSSHGLHFEAWGRYAYAVATSHDGMSSATNDVGLWAQRDVTFYVPVRVYEIRGEERVLRCVGLVPPFAYADTSAAAITGSEVSGIPTLKADIDDPPGTWMQEAGPSAARHKDLLSLSSDVLPAMFEGAGTRRVELLTVVDGLVLPYNDEVGWRKVAESWGKIIKDEVHRKAAAQHAGAPLPAGRALAAELLGNRSPLRIFTLKQFRDLEEPEDACYQSIVEIRRTIDHVYDLQEIESRISLRIHRYPSQPIVDLLGLVVKSSTDDGHGRLDILEPVRPFWMVVSMHEDLGRTVCRRAGSKEWSNDPADATDPFGPSFFDPERADRLGEGLDAIIDAAAPQRLRTRIDEWLADPGRQPLTTEQARGAVDALEPQLILESVLSREWENWGSPRWWAAAEELRRALREVTERTLDLEEIVNGQQEVLQTRAAALTRTSPRSEIYDEVLEEQLRALEAAGDYVLAMAASQHRLAAIRTKVKEGRTLEELIEECAPLFQTPEAQQDLLLALASWGGEPPPDDATPTEVLAHVLRDAGSPERLKMVEEVGRFFVEAARKNFEAALERAVVKIAKAAQKPNFFVASDTLQTRERHLVFPEHELWNGLYWVPERPAPLAGLSVEPPPGLPPSSPPPSSAPPSASNDEGPRAAPSAPPGSQRSAEAPAAQGGPVSQAPVSQPPVSQSRRPPRSSRASKA